MEHNNQYLSEILYLIDKYVDEKKINNTDLEKIEKLIDEVRKRETTRSTTHNKIIIPEARAKRYNEKFNRFFKGNINIEKSFTVKSSLFKHSIDNQENIVLRLVEYKNNLALVYVSQNSMYLIKSNSDEGVKITLDDFKKYKEAFDNGIGKHLDENLTNNTHNEGLENLKSNTRKITIFYYGNLENFKAKKISHITFIPSIIDENDNPNYHQFTLVMMYLDSDNNIINKEVYYDTFQLCPPNC